MVGSDPPSFLTGGLSKRLRQVSAVIRTTLVTVPVPRSVAV